MVDLQSRLEEAKQLEVQGRYDESDSIFSELIELAQETQDPILAASFNGRGIVRRMLGKYDDALMDYESVFDSDSDNEQKAFAWINKADIYRVSDSDLEIAHHSLDEASKFIEGESLVHVKLLYQRGLVFFAEKDYNSSIALHNEGREICESLLNSGLGDKDIKKNLGQNLQGAAVGYIFLEDCSESEMDYAYDCSIKALNIFNELDDQQGILNSVVNLGRIAEVTHNYDEAILQYEKGMEILRNTGYVRSITTLSLHLAEAHLVNGQLNEAVSYLERFVKGVVGEEITDHDKSIMGDRYNRVNNLYNQSGLNVESFKGLEF